MNEIITIDGPVASGKSTLSLLLAKRLDYLYLDTGAMYRAVALQAKRTGIDTGDKQELQELCQNLDLRFHTDGEGTKLYLGDEDISLAIRTPEMEQLSSTISAIKELREAMTIVFPEAEYKFFITASTKVRSERRYKERIDRGESVSLEEVERELQMRDHQDETRPIAPLRQAKDAKIIDTTSLNPDEMVEKILENMGNEEV